MPSIPANPTAPLPVPPKSHWKPPETGGKEFRKPPPSTSTLDHTFQVHGYIKHDAAQVDKGLISFRQFIVILFVTAVTVLLFWFWFIGEKWPTSIAPHSSKEPTNHTVVKVLPEERMEHRPPDASTDSGYAYGFREGRGDGGATNGTLESSYPGLGDGASADYLLADSN